MHLITCSILVTPAWRPYPRLHEINEKGLYVGHADQCFGSGPVIRRGWELALPDKALSLCGE
jgi:phage tail protein X